MKRLLVVQHGPWEGPGVFLLSAAARAKVRLQIIRVWQQPLPDPIDYDGLLVLGGSPNVGQEEQYPFLIPEKRMIRRAIAHDLPYLGFCLGHQLLANVMGGRVGDNFRPSVGFIRGHLTHAGREHPIMQRLPRQPKMFKWHGQAVLEPLPKQLEVLATSADCQVEAIAVQGRPHILGLQFDNHAAAPEDVAGWLQKDGKWLASLPGITIDPAAIIADAKRQRSVVQKEFDALFDGFLAANGCV